MTYAEYLASKKIDPELFRSGSPELFIKWQTDFEQVHPASFTARHLFLINKTRRQFPLRIGTPSNEPGMSEAAPAAPSPAKPRPVLRPKTN